MAHIYSKGWFVSELKKAGIMKYEERKLEKYKMHILRSLYLEKVVGEKN